MYTPSKSTGIIVPLLVGAALCFARCGVAQPQDPDVRLTRAMSLEDCIGVALENNLELRVALTEMQQALATHGEAMGAFWPDVTFFGEYADHWWYGQVPNFAEKIRIGNTLVTNQLPTGGRVEVYYNVLHDWLHPDQHDLPQKELQAGIVQPLLRGGGWRAGTGGVKDASYEVKIAEANLAAVRLSVIAQVKSSYYEVIRQTKLVQVNQEAIKRDDQLVLHSQSKLEAGLATRRDQLSAEIIQAQDRGKLADAETERAHAMDQLARAMGVRLGTPFEVAQQDVDFDPIQTSEAEWISQAQERNPMILSARLAEERSQLNMKLAGNARLPQVDLGIFYRTYHDNDVNEEQIVENYLEYLLGNVPKPLDPTSFEGMSYQLTVNFPIGNKTFGNAYKRTKYVHEASQRIREDVEEQTIADLRAAVRNLNNNTVRLGILEKEMEGARNKLEFATINFQLGRASNLDVTDAQKDLLDAETDYVNKVIDSLIGLAQIEALIGGL